MSAGVEGKPGGSDGGRAARRDEGRWIQVRLMQLMPKPFPVPIQSPLPPPCNGCASQEGVIFGFSRPATFGSSLPVPMTQTPQNESACLSLSLICAQRCQPRVLTSFVVHALDSVDDGCPKFRSNRSGIKDSTR